MLDSIQFKSQMDRLIEIYGDIDRGMLKREYYPIVEKMGEDSFLKLVEFIKDNWYGKGFPSTAYFEKSKIGNRKPENNYTPNPNTEQDAEDTRLQMQRLKEKYPSRIKRPGDIPKQAALHFNMAKAGKIYSHRLSKWVDKSLRNNIGGTFSEPIVDKDCLTSKE